MNGTVIAANRALSSRGYSAAEARVEPAEDLAPGQCRLLGTMLQGVETGRATHLLRVVSMIPERYVLAEARSMWRRGADGGHS